MATTYQTIQGNLRAANEAHRTELPAAELQAQATDFRLLEITQILQTTLEIEDLLALYHREIKRYGLHSGVRYEHDALGIECSHGHSAHHTCQYRLVMGNEKLGTLTFMRRKRFSSAETNRLENLLCVLMYPLRNALRYHSAIQSAHTDPLTGVCNRAALSTALRREFSLAQRQDTPLSLLLIDIDHFKQINDIHGHASGDCVLRAVADRIGSTIRSTDMLFRYGGEEFLVVLSNTDTAGCELLGERIRRTLADLPCACGDSEVPVTVSLGGATLRDEESIDGLFNRTDTALYEAKNNGRNRTVVTA